MASRGIVEFGGRNYVERRMNYKKSPLLVSNYAALALSLTVLVAILVTLNRISVSNGGILFGMVFALTFPVLLLFGCAGAILYLVLLLFNIRATARSRKDVIFSQENRRVWITFSGTTAAVILITVIFGLVTTPLVIVLGREFSVRNPFRTSSIRNVPVYPAEIRDDQSQYDEIDETLFRSYNVENTHPDEIAAWHESTFSEPPWSIIQINHYVEDDPYIGRTAYYCFQVKHEEGRNQPQTYFIEIFGEDAKSYDGTHVNIGTPKPITNVCEQFLNKP